MLSSGGFGSLARQALVLVWIVPTVTVMSSLVSAGHAVAQVDEVDAGAEVVATQVGDAFVPITPCRLYDSRQSGLRVGGGTTTRIQVTDRCGAPVDATAVSLTITTVSATDSGFITAFASGSDRPGVSTLNVPPGATIANSAIVALGADGAIEVHASASVHLIVDLGGAFVSANGPRSSGRFKAMTPTRLLDTRSSGQRGAGDLVIPLPPGVAPDATALALSVTIVEASQPSFLTIHPAGTVRPLSSVVNADSLQSTRAVTVLAAVSSAGLIVHRSATSDVIVDASGWFTGPSAEPGLDGLFVEQTPRRVWDSRATLDPIHAGGTVERMVLDAPAAAVVVNVTAVDATRPGFVSTFPAGTSQPNVSMLNVLWRSPIASLAVVPVSSRGMSIFASMGAHMVLDITGWFTGAPVVARGEPASNLAPRSGGRVLFVSDSSLAGIRWSKALGWLQGADFTSDLESCRRLVGTSCRGREGYAPSTAEWAILGAPGTFDVLVIGAGYNDFSSSFPSGFDAVIAAARQRGISRILWLSYRESVSYTSPQGASNAETFAANNAWIRQRLASGLYPDVEIADWNRYTATMPTWLTADGVHVTPDGARAAAEYISRTLAFLDRRVCPAGIGGVAAPGGWCARPDLVGPP